ncbi:MAG: ATP-binding protein [Ignavibacteria bacterium]|nr:ATP-binding protein [Ignavibacteria bacterium]
MALLHLSGEATFDTVRLVGMAIRAVCASVSSSSEAAQIELAVVEASNNIVEHAYRAVQGDIALDVDIGEKKIVIALHDTGETMPTASHQSANLDFDPMNLDDLPEGGMGLFLMTSIMDEQSYVSVNGKNTLTLTKFLHGENND